MFRLRQVNDSTPIQDAIAGSFRSRKSRLRSMKQASPKSLPARGRTICPKVISSTIILVSYLIMLMAIFCFAWLERCEVLCR